MKKRVDNSNNLAGNHKITNTCSKCKRSSDQKNIILCSGCKLTFHLDCDGYPEKLFRMKEPQDRKNWKCKTCIKKSPSSSKNPLPLTSNITTRKANKKTPKQSKPNDWFSKPTPVTSSSQKINETEDFVISTASAEATSFASTTDSNSYSETTTMDDLSGGSLHSSVSPSQESQSIIQLRNSITNTMVQSRLSMSVDHVASEVETVIEMREEIDRLTSELASTQNQLEEEIIENNGLKRRIDKLQRDVETLKNLCHSTNLRLSSRGDKDVSASIQTDKNAISSLANNRSRDPYLSHDTLRECKDTKREKENLRQLSSIKALEQDLKVFKTQIQQLNKQFETLSANFFTANYLEVPDSEPNFTNTSTPKPIRTAQSSTILSKVCLISNYSNDMLQMVQQAFPGESTCLYLKPGASTRDLFYGLQTKLQGFTLNDFCIIYIGDVDFKQSVNYQNLVELIQENLCQVQHTNIIICSPVFKFNNLFIKRVELFNNLLCKANMKSKFCYILDSNLNLSYDYDMFTHRGNLNKLGFATIFNDLMFLLSFFPIDYYDIIDNVTNDINGETQMNTQQTSLNVPQSSKFFRS